MAVSTPVLRPAGVTASVAARAWLGARQHDVLAALLTGLTPDGFEPHSTRVTGGVLRRKRWLRVAAALPELRTHEGADRLFDVWARQHPSPGCGHSDLGDFLDWASSGHAWARTLLRRQQVDDAQRAVAVVAENGGWTLVLGLGDVVYELPLWRPLWRRR